MTGVVVHMLIGLVLFIPFGFVVGFIQHKNEQEKEAQNSGDPFHDR